MSPSVALLGPGQSYKTRRKQQGKVRLGKAPSTEKGVARQYWWPVTAHYPGCHVSTLL